VVREDLPRLSTQGEVRSFAALDRKIAAIRKEAA